QSGVELPTVEGTLSFAHHRVRIQCSIVQEDKIEIRYIAQLDATEFAVTNDNEVHLAMFSLRVDRVAVLAHQNIPPQCQYLFQTRLRGERQVIADLHYGQSAGNLGGGHLQGMGLLEVAQQVH